MGKKLQRSRNFFRDLKKRDSPAPVYYLHGEETYMLDEAVDAVIDFAAPDGLNDFNYDAFQGRDATGEAIVSACEMLPMMVDRRLVVVRDAQAMPMSELEELSEYLDDPAETTCLIVHANTTQTSLDGRRSVVRKLKKAGESCEFAALYDNEVGEILNRHASKRDLRLTPAASAYLIEAVGTDLTSLNSALDKIDLFAGETDESPRLVDDDTVKEVVADTKVRTVFDLTETLGDKQFEEALRILDSMLLNGESPIGILAMIARHFRIVARLHDPEVRNLNRRDKASAVGVVPFFLKDYQRHARKFSLDDLTVIRRKVLEIDEALKSTGLDDRTLMESLLYDICHRSVAGPAAE
ncbi:MAG: DNA polymerase III subunit delta [Myxococcota bacterium]